MSEDRVVPDAGTERYLSSEEFLASLNTPRRGSLGLEGEVVTEKGRVVPEAAAVVTYEVAADAILVVLDFWKGDMSADAVEAFETLADRLRVGR